MSDGSTGSDGAGSEGAGSEGAGVLDPVYRDAVLDLLGVLAYGELMAFERTAADAALASLITDKEALAEMATAEYRHYVLLRERIASMGADPLDAMAPFVQPLDEFHAHTRPRGWLEGLMKAYVGDGVAMDFYREIAAYLDPQTQEIVNAVCDDLGHSAFIVERIRSAIREDPRVAGRLALWGRRLIGEAMSQAQRVAAERDALSALLVGGLGRPGVDLAEFGRMLTRLTENHSRRMASLGLSS